MMLYYMDSDEKFISKSHKISLGPELNPTETFSRSETKLLGKPLKLAEVSGIIYEETPTYSAGLLVFYIGGTLGLLLGLSILDLMMFSSLVFKKCIRGLEYLRHKMIRIKSVSRVN